MKVVALAGGTGSAKLLAGLKELGDQLAVICNVGDNFLWHGLPVCPDIDISMYALAGKGDRERGWGLEGDTFHTLSELGRLGAETWFRMGDRDLATSVLRANLMGKGMTLTGATEELARRQGLDQRVLPITDDPLETHILTSAGERHLQEFWVRDRGRGPVAGVVYRGAEKAAISESARKEMLDADRLLVCPANPVTSIGPMLAVKGVVDALVETSGRISALSPMKGRAPISGPAGKLMKSVGVRPDSAGVAGLYSGFLDVLIIDRADAALSRQVEAAGPRCVLSDITMRGKRDASRLAKELIAC